VRAAAPHAFCDTRVNTGARTDSGEERNIEPTPVASGLSYPLDTSGEPVTTGAEEAGDLEAHRDAA
jgi:hypothetical protein